MKDDGKVKYYIKRDFDEYFKYLNPNEQFEFQIANEEYLKLMDKVISIQIKQDKLKGTIPDPDNDEAFDNYFDDDKKITKQKEN